MSRTFTSKAAVTTGRGRGTQQNQLNRTQPLRAQGARPAAGRVVGRDVQANTDMEENQQQPDQPEAERKMTYQGGYSMITPNQKKRQQVTQMAQKETELYENHKQKNTPKSFNYVGTAGGGAMSQAEARQKQTAPTKTHQLLKKQEKKSFVKQKEEEELQKKKEEQRKKALQNEQRKINEEKDKESRWDQQRRRTNESFLRRFENKAKHRTEGVNAANTSVTQTPSRSETHRYMEPEQEHLQPQGASASGYESRDSVPMRFEEECSADDDLTSDEMQRLEALAAIFPQYSDSELIEILRQVGFSLDSAIDLLQD